MGLLSRLGNRAANFADGAMQRMGSRADPLNFTSDRFAPVSSAAGGALAGAGVGAASNPSDPAAGALMGAGIGAAGGAGMSLARQGAAGLRGGMRQMQAMGDANPMQIADSIRNLAQTQGPQAAQQALSELGQSNPALAQEVLQYLT